MGPNISFSNSSSLTISVYTIAVYRGHVKDKLKLEQEEEKNVVASSVEELSRSWIEWLCIHLPESQLPAR